MRLYKKLDRNSSLFDCASERSESQFPVKRDNATAAPASENHVTPFLTNNHESKAVENSDGFPPGNAGKLRH
jgi:hypothetical protein